MIKFVDNTAVPLGNEPVYYNNFIIGRTTSASYGFRVNAPIAIADIASIEAIKEGSRVKIDIGRNFFDGIVSFKPMHDPTGKSMRSILK
tara:strand:- start:41 stop:307 length:267 start_codon:yes stop_codon:yes gene_type:complete